MPGGGVGRTLADIELPDDGPEVVVKPVDSSGSRGVRRARGRIEIERAITHALSFSNRFLIEESVGGLHLEVNGFVIDGNFELISVGKRYFTPAPSCVPLYGGIAPDVGRVRSTLITRTMQEAVEAFGYRHGPVKADAIETPDGLVLLELAARFHGDVLSTHAAEDNRALVGFGLLGFEREVDLWRETRARRAAIEVLIV